MPQESPSNEKNKSKKRFSGRRRDYVDTFRWGFVPEEDAAGSTAPKSHVSSKSEPKKPSPSDSPRVAESDSSSKLKQGNSERAGQRKKTAKAAAAKPAVKSDAKRATKQTAKPEERAAAKAQEKSKPETKSSPEKSPEKNAKAAKPKAVKSSTDKPSAPGKRTAKGTKRTKKGVPPYTAGADKTYGGSTYNEWDEDLKLPSYGRTPVPTDDELPVPQKVVRKKTAMSEAYIAANTQAGGKQTEVPVSEVSSCGFRPRKEQVVWDPDRGEYVPLLAAEEPEPKKPTKKADSHTAAKTPVRNDKTAKPPEKQPERRGTEKQRLAKQPSEKQPPEKQKREHPPKRTTKKGTKPAEPPVVTAIPARETPASPQRERPQHERPQRERKNQQHRETRGDVPKFDISPQPDPTDVEAEVSARVSFWAELGVSETMIEALKIVRYLAPTPIQAGVFQKVRAGTDLMGQAQTGTGKTAAFSMPLIEGVETCPPGNDPVALILVPTRELAVQVRDEAIRLAYGRDIRITACYGGKPLGKQIERLKSGIDILVGTPGRILDLINRRALFLDSIQWVVLDEADRMLDIGFRPDIEKILKRTPRERQTLLFSATLPPPVVRLAEKYMKSPEVLDFSNKSVAVDTIEQFYVTVDPERKFDALVYLLEEQQPQQAIIFTRTKRGADRLARLLDKRFDKLAAIHGDMQQSDRDRVMAQVRAGKIRYLVATDVVGRGIDVSSVSHIINYDIPKFCDDYVHRVGRTGRMGREGVAFTFVTVQEGSELTRIEMRIDKLLQRAELKGFESFTKPHDSNASLDDDSPPEPPKPVFGKPVRKVRRAL